MYYAPFFILYCHSLNIFYILWSLELVSEIFYNFFTYDISGEEPDSAFIR